MTALEPRDADVAPHVVDAPVVAESEGMLGRTYRALSIGIVSVVFLIAFEATAVGTAMPVAARELHGIPLYAFAFSAYFTTSLFAMVLSGQWADRRGPLAPLATGIGAFGAGLVLSGTAGSMWMFIAGRAVQGLGGGLVIVALYVVVSRAYPERIRPHDHGRLRRELGRSVRGRPARLRQRDRASGLAVGLRRDSGSGGLPTGPRVARDPAHGVRACRSVGACRTVRPMRRIGLALAISVGAGLLQYAGQERNWFALIPAAAGVALLVPAVRGLLPVGTGRAARGLPSVVLLRGIAAGSFIAAESFVPLMLVTQRGLSPTMAGLSLAAGGGTWALGSYIQARPRLERYRERLMVGGMVLVVAAIVGAPSVLIASVPVWTVAVAWAVGCFGMGMVIASTSVLLLKLSAPEEAGANSAALQISDGLSNVLLLAEGGAAFAALGGGAVGAAHDAVEAGASGAHPGAFAVVFLPMAGVALVGAWVARRVRVKP